MEKNTWYALKADTFRQYGQSSWKLTIKGALTSRTFRVIFTMRVCQAIAKSKGFVRLTLPFFKILHRITTQRLSVDFPWQTEIGPGLNLAHGWGLVVNPGAKIGSNVTLFHGVTLGRRDFISPQGERMIKYPVIEDEVWVGPHAVIVGQVTIGRGSRIGGGAFITNDIPAHSVVVGNPSAIVKNNCVPDVCNPAPL